NKTLLKLYRVHPLARNVPALLVDDSPFDGGDEAGYRHERRLVENSAHRHRVNSGAARVFPTRVGVNRRFPWPQDSFSSVPHACGSEPMRAMPNATPDACSPRVWG